MLNYALIGLGGAIGSMLRAWLGSAMVALTGPAFPWGTILINVVGSFVIGCFATLTATDGRFAVPFDLRAFVMVGICGGFTTFSSFSLQTLELARDGRAGQALGNVALSVLLCLGGVAAGYALAMALRVSPLMAIGDLAPGTMSGSTVVALHRPESAPGLLAIAERLMATGGGRTTVLATGGGRTTVLAIDGPALAAFQPTEEVMTRGRQDRIAGRRRDWVDAMRGVLDGWVEEQRAMGRTARWIAVRGDGAMAVAEHARSAHLLLMEQDPGDGRARARVHAALARTRRPLLLVPAGDCGRFGRIIAVAWQEDGHAGAAVRSARPLLERAEQVVVLRIGRPAGECRLPKMFDGLPVAWSTAEPDGTGTGVQLLAMAGQAGADLLVMGSDSHIAESVVAHAGIAVLQGWALPRPAKGQSPF